MTDGKNSTAKQDQSALEETEKSRSDEADKSSATPTNAEEIGGRDGLDPTRYGDWERKGILSDF